MAVAAGALAAGEESSSSRPEIVQAGAASCGLFPRSDNGPHDYRYVRDHRLKVVQDFHFTSNVESLSKGNSTAYVGGEIGFTLLAFPNHHRALVAMVRLGVKEKTERPAGSRHTIDCWLDRAVRFAPDDTVARMIYADYLRSTARPIAAKQQLDRVVQMAGDNAFSHHNAGLLYFELKLYDQALEQAKRSISLGWQRTELRDRLMAAGKWDDGQQPARPAAGGSLPYVVQPSTDASSAASR